LAGVLSFLVLSGWALAGQTAEQKQDSSMMEHMMKEREKKSRGGHYADDENDGSVRVDDGLAPF
jgi:hypothetical protein